MFIAAIFLRAKNWKWPKCPLAEKWKEANWDIFIQWKEGKDKLNNINESKKYYTKWKKQM